MALKGLQPPRRYQYFLLWCVLLVSLFLDGAAKVMESSGGSNSTVVQNDQSAQDEDEATMDCIDWEGKPVADGEKYIPYGSDLCMRCLCENRFPILCQSVACSAPQNCPNAQPIAGKCCEYECLPRDSEDNGNSTGVGQNPTKDAEESITNLSLRLIASTVTSLLFLALLLFMVYRLRQRRLLLAMRRFEARSRNSNLEDTDSDHYIPDSLLSLECPPYTDPPPPYSPPKPPHIYQGEQPPPYDEISLTENSEGRADRPGQPRHSASGSEINGTNAPWLQGQISQATLEREIPRTAMDTQGQSVTRQQVDTLPAYASTDVIQGLDNMFVSRTPSGQRNWNEWAAVGSLQLQLDPRNSFHERNGVVASSSGRQRCFDRPASERHSMPTVTAFQRFSSLFKRNAPKCKNRNTQARPLSECQPPPQYATLPHDASNTSLARYTGFNNSNRQAHGNSSRSVARNLTDRMCFSYDSARAAYELAAMSPSTSSNSSSSGGLASCSPRRRESGQQNTLHMQQFQDDLRRHLPPLQTSDSSERTAQTSLGTCPSTLSPSSSSIVNQTPLYQQPLSGDGHGQMACSDTSPHFHPAREASATLAQSEREAPASIVYDLTGSLTGLTSSSSPTASPSHPHRQSPGRSKERQSSRPGIVPKLDIHPQASSSSFHQTPSTQPSDPPSFQLGQDPSSSSRAGVENSRNVPGKKTPSPPVPSGIMRRSQSGVSVCSETGEKKLKDSESRAEHKILASDSQYPEHQSLSRLKPSSASSFKRPEAVSHLQNISPVNHSEDANHDNSGGSSCPRDAVCEASQIPATLLVSHNITHGGDEMGEERVPPDPKAQGVVYGGSCYQENDLNKAIKNQVDSNHTAFTSTPLNIRPTSPFVTSQSGQLIPVGLGRPKHHMPSETEARFATDMTDMHSESKKIKKKKSSKEKASVHPSPQHCSNQKLKHPMSSSHGNGGSGAVKSDGPCRDVPARTSSKSRQSRGGEKKKRVLSSLTPPLETLDHFPADWMTHSCDDNNLVGYGNADVYRSYRCDVVPTASILPHDYPSLQGYANGKIALGTKEDNYGVTQQNLAHSYPFDKPTSHLKSGLSDRAVHQPPATKRKPVHKRQASAGERIHTTSGSPSHQHHQRPKLLAVTADRVHGGRKNELPPDSVSGDPRRHSIGKGAKSGFGQDMNLDDQLGMIDFFNHGVDYSATKTAAGRGSFSNDSNVILQGNLRPHARNSIESGNQLHGNSRSGLSSDLSFVNGSCPVGEKGKKRASLPSLPMFAGHSQGGINLGAKNIMGKNDARVDREARHWNSVPDEGESQATSYV